jgi:outer membrane scaffolding protein for murein synthesis (MipA/OmpV family)
MRRLLLPAIAFAASSVSAAAQDVSQVAPDAGVFEGDYLIVGAGAASVPSYEGSDDRTVVPAIGVLGEIGGVGISPRAAGLALDFVPDGRDARIGFNLGPVFRYRSNRARNIKDPVVKRLGELDSVIEGGVAVGFTVHGLFNSYDRLSAGSDFRWDISGKGGGMSIAPGVTYFTPLSRAFVVGGRVGAEFVDDRYANYNYGISAAGSAASGLPQYHAHGGLKEINAAAFVGYDLSGNFLDGGLAIGGGAMYSRLQGSAADTPITAIRGSRNQWFFGGGLAYTF